MNMKENIMKRKTLQHMIKRIYQLIFVLLFTVSGVMAQTVQIHDVVEEPGVILVPLDMLNFTNVGAITLDIEYDSDLLTFSGFENPALPGILANYSADDDFLRVTYMGMGGVSINGKLLDLKFSYPGGFSTAVAVTSAEIVNTSLAPIASTFIPGSVTQVTTTNVVTLVDPGLVLTGNTATVPVTIEGPDFGAVNSITLKIAYDPAQLVYAGKIDGAITGVVAAANSNGLLTLTWIGSAQNFTSQTTLLDLKFVYHGGGDAALSFYPGSEIADNLSLIAVNYENTVVSPYFEDPTLTLGTVTGTPGQGVVVPVTALDFGAYQVGAMTLKVGYDPAKLTFTGFTPFQPLTGWVVSASGGVVTLNRSNTTALTIADGLLVALNFQYNGGGDASVVFNPGTELKTVNLVTIPVEFVNGMVSPDDYTAVLTLGEVVGVTGFPVIVPLSASGFDPLVSVGSVTIKVGYPGDQLVFTGYTASNPSFSGWVVDNTTDEVVFNWSNSGGQVLADGLLLELNFNYPGTEIAPVVFNPGVELFDTDLNLIPLSLIDGGVNVLPSGYKVSGFLKYADNAGTPLPNSDVYLMSSDGLTILETVVTDVNGYYEFLNVANGDYKLDASTTIAWGGVDIDDAIDVYDFWDTGAPVLSGIFFTAADVNVDSIVDIDDAIDIYDAWNDGVLPATWNAPNWVFENPDVTVSGSDVSVDVQGLCAGDVNADRF